MNRETLADDRPGLPLTNRAMSTEQRRLNELRTLSRQVYEALAARVVETPDAWAGGQLLEVGQFLDATLTSLENVAARLGVR